MASEDSFKSEENKSRSSESQETEPDSDSVWSTASEDRSDVDTDPISSDSVSHELLTVRDKAVGGSCDIQQLISAAEALALERARQNMSTLSHIGGISKQNEYDADSCSMNSPSGKNASAESIGTPCTSQASFDNCDSGYYGKSNNMSETLSPSTSATCESDHNLLSKQSFFNSVKTSGLRTNMPESMSGNTAQLSTVPKELALEKNVSFGKGRDTSVYNVPKLPLDSVPKTDLKATGINDDKGNVTKETKEVCNSTIKESHESPEVHLPVKKLTTEVTSSACSSKLNLNSSTKKVSSLVHDECSDLLRLALSSTSSLSRVLRLLRQVMTLQFGNETPRVAESIKKELQEYEVQHVSLEGQLHSKSAQLQNTLSEVQMIELLLQEQESGRVAVDKIASQILQQIEEALSSSGLQHMVSVTSPRRRSVARNLEDAETALSLLLAELGRKTTRCKNLESDAHCLEKEVEDLRKSLFSGEERMLTTLRELSQVKEWSTSEISSLKYCLAQAEENLAEIRLESDHTKEIFKRKEEDDKAMINRLQKQLADAHHSSDSRVSYAENNLQDITKEKLNVEISLQETLQKLSIQEQQIILIEEENKFLVDSLRSTIKHQQADIEQIRLQLDQELSEKHNISRRADDLEVELSKAQELHHTLQEEASKLRDSAENIKQEYADNKKNLQSMIDKITEERGELERQVRSRDFTILQLHTELQLDGQRIAILTQDNENLLQKVKNLQEQLWDLTRRHRLSSNSSSRGSDDRNVYGTSFRKQAIPQNGSCQNLLLGPLEGSLNNQKYQDLEKNVNDSHRREECLHKLLAEKDTTIDGLQSSFASDLSAKNKELEVLRCKLSELEEQMGSLLSGLQVSAAIGSVTTEVGRLLQERTEHLESLNQSSHVLQDEYTILSLENEKLKKELSTVRRNNAEMSGEVLETTRRAKEEARQERLNAARSAEKCCKLQAELDFTMTVLEQERQERQMKDMIQQLKHESFEAVLSTTSSSINSSST